MREGFRQAMAWLHTWTGLIFGWLLFAIFLTGTMSYFKEEIIHWAHFMSMVMPASIIASYGDDTQGFFSDVFGAPEPLKASGVAAPLLALPTLYEKVLAQSPGSRLGWIEVQNPGDQNARVKFSPHAGDRIAHVN